MSAADYGLPALILLVAIYGLFRLAQGSLRVVFLLLMRSLAGGAAIWLFNAAAGVVGFHLGLNPASALAAGLLGIPGIALLVCLKVILA